MLFMQFYMKRFHLQNDYIQNYTICCNPSLGFVTKARACKGAGQEGSPRVTYHAPVSVRECEGMKSHTPKVVALTLPSELPLWEWESRWTSEFLEKNCKGQNPLN